MRMIFYILLVVGLAVLGWWLVQNLLGGFYNF